MTESFVDWNHVLNLVVELVRLAGDREFEGVLLAGTGQLGCAGGWAGLAGLGRLGWAGWGWLGWAGLGWAGGLGRVGPRTGLVSFRLLGWARQDRSAFRPGFAMEHPA